jgi:hypothetical protein
MCWRTQNSAFAAGALIGCFAGGLFPALYSVLSSPAQAGDPVTPVFRSGHGNGSIDSALITGTPPSRGMTLWNELKLQRY